MDERENKVDCLHVSYNENKIYFNDTHHMMNDGLRISNMTIKSVPKNLTVGAVGNFYDVYFRNWNIDNLIIAPQMKINNNMLPDVTNFYVPVHKSIDFGKLGVSGKAGISYQTIGKNGRLDF